MLNSTVTLNTREYSLQTQRTLSSVRGVASRPYEPLTLTVSHEIAKSGRVRTGVIFDDVRNVAASSSSACTTTKPSNIRLSLALSYNPSEGRDAADLDGTIDALRNDLIALINDAAVWTKLKNKES